MPGSFRLTPRSSEMSEDRDPLNRSISCETLLLLLHPVHGEPMEPRRTPAPSYQRASVPAVPAGHFGRGLSPCPYLPFGFVSVSRAVQAKPRTVDNPLVVPEECEIKLNHTSELFHWARRCSGRGRGGGHTKRAGATSSALSSGPALTRV